MNEYESRIPADVFKALREEALKYLKTNELESTRIKQIKDFDTLVLELDVYQTELEIQNQELMETQQRLEIALEKYSDLYNFAPVGYITVDKNGVILESNLTISEMLGKERKLIIGKPFTVFVDNGYRDFFYNYLTLLKSCEGVRKTIDIDMLRKDGYVFSGLLISDGFKENEFQVETARIVLQDISERKKIELELQQKNREMEDFAHKLSHDIKNPLINIYTYLELIEEDQVEDKEYFSKARNILHKVTDYLDKILELSRAGKCIDELKKVQVKEIISSAKSIAQNYNIPHRFKVKINYDYLTCDEKSMQNVFSNLIENAFNYRDPGKDLLSIEIVCQKNRGKFEILFRDNGIGIDKANFDKVFLPGYTVSSKKGTGFGLSIVNKIIKAHNGEITINSDGENKGTEFKILLPV